jgi:protein-S-isoprenylcysteine O-methyltransferase Ste14
VAQRVLTPHKAKATPLRRTASAATAACSIALMGSAARAFRKHSTTFDPFDPASSSYLVTTGPFVITRNPMYAGLSGLLAANAIRRGSLLALVPLAGFMAWVDRSQIPQEEVALSATFGADYEAYRERVPRWLRVP